MQQFVVPQFIEVEDKIIGPVTIRQFIILLVAAGIIFLMYRLADFSLFVASLAIIGGGSLILAFVKVNGQTFHYFLLNVFQSKLKPPLRVWRKQYDTAELKQILKEKPEEQATVQEQKPVARRHIRDLSLVVNTGGYYEPESMTDSDHPFTL